MAGNRMTRNRVANTVSSSVAPGAVVRLPVHGRVVRLAILLLALPVMICMTSGCRLTSRSVAESDVPSSIRGAGFADTREDRSAAGDSAEGTVRHADVSSELPGEVEHAKDVSESDRPSRWSRLIDRLRPAKRMPLPLSPEDPDSTLQDEMTAF